MRQFYYFSYLFPLNLSVAKAFKLLNEDPGGSEKILLWLKSKCRNFPSLRTTWGTCVNSFQDKSMLSSPLKSNPSKLRSPNSSRPLLTRKISLNFSIVVSSLIDLNLSIFFELAIRLISKRLTLVKFHWFKAFWMLSNETEKHLRVATRVSIREE